MLHSFFVKGSVIALAMLGASTLAIASPANESRVNPAAKFRILYSFQRQGRTLVAASTLMRDTVGNLYGTTMNGGNYGAGSVFELATDGTLTTLHSFGAVNDGEIPKDGLVQDRTGNLYGTTYYGGSNYGCGGDSCGTVFQVSSDGTENVLYNFKGGNDGWGPAAPLIVGHHGELFGTTVNGGTGCVGCGTVFEVNQLGKEKILYSFKGGSDGIAPFGGLVQDSSGNLYGTTWIGGGTGCSGDGCGTVFRVSSDGTETVLYSFAGGSDGWGLFTGLALDAAGNLYGTTVNGGSGGCDGEGCGTVFKGTPGGSHTVLYAFTGGADGSGPYFATLVLDRAGDLFGTTVAGGRNKRCNKYNGCGTIFELAADGAESVLHLFSGARGGAEPADGVINDDKGNLYGITWNGGVAKGGTIFELGR